MWKHTIASPAVIAGRGLHGGEPVRLGFKPAAPETGIVFIRKDLSGDNRIPVRADSVGATQLGTVIGNEAGASVATVEHLMAALAGLKIDNVEIELDGEEIPSVDGSSAPFVTLLKRAGLRRQGAPRRFIEVTRPVEVAEDGKRAGFVPADSGVIEVEIDFEDAAIGQQTIVYDDAEHDFETHLAAARTFGFLKDVETLRAMGRARGASMENSVVVDDGKVLNGDGLRFSDEFARHKALDALGDLYLAGAPILGRFTGYKSGHGMNNKALCALLADRSAWRWRELAEPAAAERERAL